MDPNAYLCEKNHGCKPDYTRQLRSFSIGGTSDNPQSIVTFFELTPAENAANHVWVEWRPGDTVSYNFV